MVDDLRKKTLGRKIVGVSCDTPRILKNSTPRSFPSCLIGFSIKEITRRGKNILFYLSLDEKEKILLIHPKMTGHFLVKDKGSKKAVNPHVHLVLYLEGGRTVSLSDVRKFSKVLLGERETIEALPELRYLGYEPLSATLTRTRLKELMGIERRSIKKVLLDQGIVAGLGNIYADEVLWHSRVHPLRPAHLITTQEAAALHGALRKTLTTALRLRGASLRDFRDTEGRKGNYTRVRVVYGREGEECYRCAVPVERIKIGGRSAHFCPRCQKR